ncbi:MAG: hypothetical protein L3J03_05955 [Desulfobacterales bacterium]|nr:hypothetical protein [Desulfobacterales bacterium]
MNKNGRALVFPRPLLPEVKKREYFGRTGAYLLQRPREDGEGKLLYISDEPDTAGSSENQKEPSPHFSQAVCQRQSLAPRRPPAIRPVGAPMLALDLA